MWESWCREQKRCREQRQQGRGEAGCLQAAAEAAGLCLLPSFALPGMCSLLAHIFLAADQRGVIACYL